MVDEVKNDDIIFLVKGVIVVFGEKVVFDNFDFDVCCGEIFGFVGVLGIGKLVFMCMIFKFVLCKFGLILIFGYDYDLFDVKECVEMDMCFGVFF